MRGVHHYMAQAMIVLLVLHLMQVVIDGAYRAPRELNFWFGALMMGSDFGPVADWLFTSVDQKGYWATAVATNLMAEVPWIGSAIQKIVVGGVEYGHHTLTRFFALHAGVLPAMLIGLVVIHIYLFRKHGIHVKEPRPKKRFRFLARPDSQGCHCLFGNSLSCRWIDPLFQGCSFGTTSRSSQ